MAFAAEPDNLQFKVAVARAMPHAQRAEKLALLREAAAQGDAEANYEIYESHKSWDRGDLDKAPMVPRAEADRALRKAAELGHPFSTQMLAILLDRGTTVKRDPVAARYWVERALDNPAKDEEPGKSPGVPRTPAGEFGQTGGTRPRPGDTRTTAVRPGTTSSAPGANWRARSARTTRCARESCSRRRCSPDPGGATPLLAEMLIAGEGGPADPQRALKLLKAPRDTVGVKGVLGQVYLEGKLVPRDVQEAVNLIDMAGTWDLDARQQVVRLLAAHPETRVTHPKHVALLRGSRPPNSTNPGR